MNIERSKEFTLGLESIDDQADFFIKRLEEYERGVADEKSCGCHTDFSELNCKGCLIYDQDKGLTCNKAFETEDGTSLKPLYAREDLVRGRNTPIVESWFKEMLRRININLERHGKWYRLVVVKD